MSPLSFILPHQGGGENLKAVLAAWHTEGKSIVGANPKERLP